MIAENMMVKLPTTILRYGVALTAVALALVITLNIYPLIERMPFALFFVAVLIATRYGGRIAGLMALILSALAIDYFIIPPVYTLIKPATGSFQIAVFVVVALMLFLCLTALYRREKAVQQEEGRYRLLFENNPMPMWVFDLETLEFLAVNDAATRNYGYSREEFLSMTLKNIRPVEDMEGLMSEVSQSDMNLKSIGIWRHLTKDGRILHVEIVWQELRFEGKPARLVLATDVTAREQAAASLRDSEARYHTLFELAPDGILIADPLSYYLDANDTMCRMLGYSRDELIGLHGSDIVAVDEIPQIGPALSEIKTRSGYNRKWQFRRKDGSVFAGEVIATQMPDGNILAVVRDITARKDEEAVRESLAAIVASSDDAIIGKDLNSVVTTWNTAAERIFGYTRHEMIGQTLMRLIPPDRIDEEAMIIAKIMTGEIVDHFETVRIGKDGKPIHVLVTISPIKDGAGNITGASKIARDITQLKRAENERRIIFEIIQGSITAPNLNEFLKLVHRSISQIVYAENCFVMLHNPLTDVISFEFWVDRRDDPPAPKPLGRGFASYILRTGKPLRLTKESRKTLEEQGEAEHIGSVAESWLGVPLRTPSRTIGVLVLQHYEDEHAYSQRDLEFLSSVGDQIALAIERKRSEGALSDSEERYRDVVENAIDVIYTHDLEGNYTSVNRAAERIMGYTREEALGMNLIQVVAPEYREKAARMIAAKLAGEDVPPYDLEVIAKDGHHVSVEINTRVIYEDEIPVSVQGIARDITERKKAEEALAEAEEKYRSIFENAVGGIFQSTPDGEFLSVNPAMAQILGFESPEDLISHRTDISSQYYVDENCRGDLERMLAEQGVVLGFECEVYRRDRSKIWTQENIRVVRDSKGKVLFYEGSIEDITERKHLEEQFRQSQKMEAIGLLAGGIAHDFNNLLTAINGYSDLTLRKLHADDPLRVNIKEIRDAGQRAAALTGQLLAFSRKQVLKPRVHNLNAVITEIERMLRRIIRESIEFEIVLDPELGNIRADPGQIEQVIMNMVVNARDAMPDGGKLTIETESVFLNEAETSQPLSVVSGPFVKMTVKDTGHGIDQETRRRIFEPFFTTKEVGKGSGLGLSTVHGIIMQSGGDIVVRSKVGRGTTFEVYLPCVDESVQAPKWVEANEDDYSGTETILLVEDEEIVRNLVRAILRGNGYSVLEAAGGEAALSIFDTYTGKIDLLLTDIVMPGIGGGELKDRAIEMRPDIKVLFMSGYTDDSLSLSGILNSGTVLLEKPFTPDGLSRKVREVLES